MPLPRYSCKSSHSFLRQQHSCHNCHRWQDCPRCQDCQSSPSSPRQQHSCNNCHCSCPRQQHSCIGCHHSCPRQQQSCQDSLFFRFLASGFCASSPPASPSSPLSPSLLFSLLLPLVDRTPPSSWAGGGGTSGTCEGQIQLY